MFTCLLSSANTTPSAMIGQLSSHGLNTKAILHNFVILIMFCYFLYITKGVFSHYSMFNTCLARHMVPARFTSQI